MYNDIIPVTEGSHLLQPAIDKPNFINKESNFHHDFHEHVEVEESLSLEDREKELIKKALEKHRGKRRNAAEESRSQRALLHCNILLHYGTIEFLLGKRSHGIWNKYTREWG